MQKLTIIAILVMAAFLAASPFGIKNFIEYLNKQNPIPIQIAQGEFDVTQKIGTFHGLQIPIPTQEYLSALTLQPTLDGSVAGSSDIDEDPNDVLGSKSEKKEKRIEINLATQRLYAYSGDKEIYGFDVSTGKWGRTPTGEFRIWVKYVATLMTGGSTALGTYYYLPNVPYTMYFYNESIAKGLGYGLHGAYWHDNFGHPMSHGCVNMRIEDSKTLFAWATSEQEDGAGTKIIIYGEAPNE